MPVNKETLEKALMIARKREAEEVFKIFSDLVIRNDVDTVKEFVSNPELKWCIDIKKVLEGKKETPFQYAILNNHFAMAKFLKDIYEKKTQRPKPKF